MRRFARFAIYGPLALLIGACALFLILARVGQSGLEAWLGEQIKQDVNARGKLRLAFDSIDYQAPRRLVIEGLTIARVMADGSDQPVFEIDHAQVDLAEIPRRGEPIKIADVQFDHPVLRVDGLMRHDDGVPGKPPPPPKTATTRPLSSILWLRHVEIRNGSITYDDRSGRPPLAWDKLNLRCDIDRSDWPWHRTTLRVDQSPLMKLDVDGDLNLDELALRDGVLKASLKLNDDAALQFFTPPVQAWLRKYDVQGQCDVTIKGDGSLRQRETSALDATATLTGGRFQIGAYRVPLDQFDLTATLRGTRAVIDFCKAQGLGGVASFSGAMTLDGERPLQGQLRIDELRLQQLMRENVNDPTKTIAGVLTGELNIRSTVAQLKMLKTPEGANLAWGSGTVHVERGRLVNLPIIGELVAATKRVRNLLTGDRGVHRDRLDMNLRGVGRRWELDDIVYLGDVVAARGHGSIGFKGDVDLTLNAGPLENLQERLGPLGDLWASMSDRLMSYRVRGKLKDPEVTPQLGDGR